MTHSRSYYPATQAHYHIGYVEQSWFPAIHRKTFPAIAARTEITHLAAERMADVA